MYLKDVLSVLDSGTITTLKIDEDRDFLSVEIPDRNSNDWAANTLYFIRLTTLLDFIDSAGITEKQDASLVIYTDTAMPDVLTDLFTNIACIYPPDDPYSVFRTVGNIIHKSLIYNNRLQELTELIASEDNLTVLIQWISDFYDHPANIVDANFSYLAHSDLSSFEEFGSTELMNDLQNGYVAADHIEKIKSTQGYDLFRTPSTRPVLIYSPEQSFHQYHTPIPIGNTIAGAFSIYMDMEEDLDPLMKFYLRKISRLLSIALQRLDFYTMNKASFYNSFFSAMLSKSPDMFKDWENRLAGYGFRLLPDLRMIAVSYPGSITKRSELEYLANTLHHIFPGSVYYIFDNYICLLCSNPAGTFSVSDISIKGDDVFTRSNLKIGISSSFSYVYSMPAYFKEARTAIELGNRFDPNGKLYTYDSLRLYDIAGRIAEQEDVQNLCYPPFMELYKYDLENNTQLCQTLYCYYGNVKKPSEVCRILNIHKNTLYFRLGKIRSIMNRDIDLADISLQVCLTVHILRYTGELNKNNPNFTLMYR